MRNANTFFTYLHVFPYISNTNDHIVIRQNGRLDVKNSFVDLTHVSKVNNSIIPTVLMFVARNRLELAIRKDLMSKYLKFA